MTKEILSNIVRFFEKQDMLNKLTENQRLNDYGYSEIHTIVAVKELKEPNVTAIAKQLNMTRGAISKITKKLIVKSLINTYTLPDNKQKIFFELTDEGEFMYEEHKKRHDLWEARDEAFLNGFAEEELRIMENFFNAYNDYLEQRIKELLAEEKKEVGDIE